MLLDRSHSHRCQTRWRDHSEPEPEFILKPGDILYLIGKRETLLKAVEWLEPAGD
jgi:Trk K+ transport system NAD-binding subunit